MTLVGRPVGAALSWTERSSRCSVASIAGLPDGWRRLPAAAGRRVMTQRASDRCSEGATTSMSFPNGVNFRIEITGVWSMQRSAQTAIR